jgi:hypothetical protein
MTREQAAAAQQKVIEQVAPFHWPDRGPVNGVGIAPTEKGFAVKVMLVREDASLVLPTAVDGVPVICEVVGVPRAWRA